MIVVWSQDCPFALKSKIIIIIVTRSFNELCIQYYIRLHRSYLYDNDSNNYRKKYIEIKCKSNEMYFLWITFFFLHYMVCARVSFNQIQYKSYIT